ncbi:MAG: hypothetical protein R3Y57_07490 [Erysipelotrichaceae bacterium]
MKNWLMKYKKLTIVCIWLLSTLCFTVICMQYGQDEFAAFKTGIKSILGLNESEVVQEEVIVEEEESDTSIIITVNGFDVEIDYETLSYTWFDAKQMSTEVLNSFEFTDIEGYDIYFEGEKVEQGEIIYVEVETIGINYGLEIKMVSQENSAEKYFYVRTLNYDYDTVTKGEGEGDGSLFIEVDFETGEIIFEAMDSDITDNSYRAYKFDS